MENNGWPLGRVPQLLRHLPEHELEGCGIYVCGITRDLLLENNIIRETRQGNKRHQLHGIYLEPGVTRLKMKGNKISGHPQAAIIDTAHSPDNKLQKVKR